MTELPVIGKYEILQKLGEGATAVVYLARDTALGREVALKVLKPHLAGDPEMFKYFLREAQTSASLHHPHIAPIFDMGESDGRFFIAMYRVEGRALNQITRQDGPLAVEEALRMAADVAAALDYAHRRGFLHRDVKPANILRDQDGDYLLTDFGLARALNVSGLTTTNAAVPGTLAYIAPEVWNQQQLTPAVDQYALACVIYEAIDGQTLFQGELAALMAGHVLHGAVLRPTFLSRVPPGFADALLRALEREPGKRYHNCAALVQALRETLPAASPPEQPAQPGASAAPENIPDEQILPGTSDRGRETEVAVPDAGELAPARGVDAADAGEMAPARETEAAEAANMLPAHEAGAVADMEDLPAADLPANAAQHAPVLPVEIPAAAGGMLTSALPAAPDPVLTGAPTTRAGTRRTSRILKGLGITTLLVIVAVLGLILIGAWYTYQTLNAGNDSNGDQTSASEDTTSSEETGGGAEVAAPEPAYGLLAFLSDRNGQTELFRMNADGSDQTFLADTNNGSDRPVWREDGAFIVYVSGEGSDTNLYVVDVSSKEVAQVTETYGREYSPYIYNDGLMFMLYDDQRSVKELHRIDENGAQMLVEIPFHVDSLAYSPNNDEYLVVNSDSGNSDIYASKPDFSYVALTTDSNFDGEPFWSPDGSRIVFTSTRDGNNEIYSMASDGSDVIRLTDNDANDGDPAWSPDGSFIAFSSDRDGNFNIYIMDADGSNVRQVTSDDSGNNWYPSWSPSW